MAFGHQDVDQLVRPLSQRRVEVDHDLAADLLREAAEDAARAARRLERALVVLGTPFGAAADDVVGRLDRLSDLERSLEVERLGRVAQECRGADDVGPPLTVDVLVVDVELVRPHVESVSMLGEMKSSSSTSRSSPAL